jgi:membrane protease YdiL (CAAX protease family)
MAWIGAPIAILIGLRLLAEISAPAAQVVQRLADGDLVASFMFVVAIALLSIGFLYYRLQRYRAGMAELGFKRFNLGKALLYLAVAYLLLGFAVYAVFTVIDLVFPGFNPDQAQANVFTEQVTTPLTRRLSFLALVIIPAFTEEVTFRGFMFPAFAKRFGPIWGAIIVSLLFGLAHLQYNVSLYTLILSLILCFFYYKLGSIWPGIVFHLINNAIAFKVLLS